ncbi:hypothetical protein IVB15_13600 [Bradyrhizobium sp. 182]|nr:hypothetical protein [Bradyrhizobium sp. CW12]MCK1528726.1 hypothetical protein [Bradyrhizobium sp. 182]MCK1648570.1 hypothetical protein [Bradyrhizobium sp. 154]
MRSLEIGERLLQAGEARLQRVDLAIGRIQPLLMIEAELGDGLLEEIDIALEAARAPFHGLLDRADLDAGHVLRVQRQRRQRGEQQHCETNAGASEQHEGSSSIRSRQCAPFARSRGRLPHSYRILALSLRPFPRTGNDDRHAERSGRSFRGFV